MRRTLVAVAAVLLGASCAGGRATPSRSPDTPVCDRIPGRGVEGFVLDRTQRIDQPTHVAVRREYSDPEGRLLVYLLGVLGEVGEGAPVARRVELVDGTPASFVGGGPNWILRWEDEPPCPQMAVVGNGFRAEEFASLMVDAALLSPESVPAIDQGQSLTEWVGVLRTAPDLERLDPDTDALMEVASGALFIGPVGCHRRLAEAVGVPVDAFFSGVVASSRPALGRALTRATAHPDLPDEPLVSGEFEVLCLAD
ncbi:MAG TPA: hypothetical protein VHH92_06770 [Actinomycetota bacterium]|nr:hypothetical protein [Actinomycetota bacterium]